MIKSYSYQILLQKVEFDDFTCLMPTWFHPRGHQAYIDKENAFLYNAVNLQNLLPSDLIWNQDALVLNLKNCSDRSVKYILKQYFERSYFINESGERPWNYSELSVGVSCEKQLNIHVMSLVDSQFGRGTWARPGHNLWFPHEAKLKRSCVAFSGLRAVLCQQLVWYVKTLV